MGVFLIKEHLSFIEKCLPHMRGGVSCDKLPHYDNGESSPHAWGCFQEISLSKEQAEVFPTCVGVFLGFFLVFMPRTSLPHMRGGVSEYRKEDARKKRSSPHAWGCFCMIFRKGQALAVFPTCVGVFLRKEAAEAEKEGLPHMRGGVSQQS